jgi:hypothetical protein
MSSLLECYVVPNISECPRWDANLAPCYVEWVDRCVFFNGVDMWFGETVIPLSQPNEGGFVLCSLVG